MLTEVQKITLLEPSKDLLEPLEALRTFWELTPGEPGGPPGAPGNSMKHWVDVILMNL